MITSLILMILACGIWATIASILIARDLEKRGTPVEFLWLRVMILKYLGKYSRITREETGHVGPLFYHFVIPLNIALVLVIVIVVCVPGYY